MPDSESDGVVIPCSICGEAIPWANLQEHEAACLKRQVAEDERMARQMATGSSAPPVVPPSRGRAPLGATSPSSSSPAEPSWLDDDPTAMLATMMEACVMDGVRDAQQQNVKVGARVRVRPNVTEPQHHWGSVRRGDVGVVARIEGPKCWVDFERQRNWIGATSEMEVVRESRHADILENLLQARRGQLSRSGQPQAAAGLSALLARQMSSGLNSDSAGGSSSSASSLSGVEMVSSPVDANSASAPHSIVLDPTAPQPLQFMQTHSRQRTSSGTAFAPPAPAAAASAEAPGPAAFLEFTRQMVSKLSSPDIRPPPVGTCVRRNPQNLASVHEDDMNGEGVVISCDDKSVDVLWFANPHRRQKYQWTLGGQVMVSDGGHLLLGTRVRRRHPDWRWQNQDGGDGKLGTVIAFKDSLWVKIQWDCGVSNTYRWGAESAYDVMPVTDGVMAEGRKVRRNDHFWEWGEQDGRGVGTVLEVKSTGWVKVKWDSGQENSYRWGCDDPAAYDVELIGPDGCTPVPFRLPVGAGGVPAPVMNSQTPINHGTWGGGGPPTAGGAAPAQPKASKLPQPKMALSNQCNTEKARPQAASSHADPNIMGGTGMTTEEDDDGTCSICFEPMESPCFTPCIHRFHASCLFQWSQKKQECPICNTNFGAEFLRSIRKKGAGK